MKHLLTLPNILTALRFVLIPVLIILFMVEQTTSIEMATFLVFSFAAITDFVDGYLARKNDQVTVLGKLLDPLADKVLVTAALIMLIPLGKIPALASLIIISREIIVTGFRGLAATSGKVVAAGMLGKIKANLQFFGIGFLLFPLGVLPIAHQHEIGRILIYASIILAVWSAFEYFYKLREVFLEPPE